MSTPNNGIPYAEENTLDPAAGLNLALNVVDALLNSAVLSMALTAPPGSPADGDLYIVGPGATGAWAGRSGDLARYVTTGAFWQFYTRGTQARLVFNKADGGLYWFDDTTSPGAWRFLAIAGGLTVHDDNSPPSVSVSGVKVLVIGPGLQVVQLAPGVARLQVGT